jgi:iron complex outermembrane receptor protein
MQTLRPLVTGLALTILAAVPARAQQAPAQQSARNQSQTQTAAPPPGQGQAQAPPTTPADPKEVSYKETVVVSASKVEQQLIDAPATMTVIGPRALSVAPSGSYGDLLRSAPGVNVTQISARDINVTSRGATSSLATSQLTVVDGRSVYQDFFGFTMWDFVPSNLDEVKRIEVIRGPASAVWGANALNGVVNIITKSPREMQGTWATFGIGGFGKEVSSNGASGGSLFYARGTHARAANDRLAYKVSAGISASDAFARPIGNVPNGLTPPTPYPPFENKGSDQPKLDVRVDYDYPDGVRKLQFSGGIAGTDGIMHTGIGPFDINSGTTMGYWKANYTRKAFHLQAFMNVLDGKAVNLVSVNPSGAPILLDFDTKTFDVELGDTRVLGGRHVFTYGGNFRINRFKLTIAPGEDGREEGGAYVQDEYLWTEKMRVVAGARVDKFSSIDNAVFSPRVAFIVKPRPIESVRVSYNRAFRAPSVVNNNLDTTIGTALPLGAINPAFAALGTYYVPTAAAGNPDLTEERIDTFEVAYTGTLKDKANVTAAWYYSKFAGQINFTNIIDGVPQVWGPAPPPPGWPLPALVWAGVYQSGIRFPSRFTYVNLGEVISKGLELGVDGPIPIGPDLTGFVNYSYQWDPIPSYPGLTPQQAAQETNLPAKHLFNIGVTYTGGKAFGTFAVTHSSEAFWQDVLDDRYHGFTKPYTSVNLTVGMKWEGGRYTAALKMMNLGNEQIQQHVFGDIFKRQIVGEFRVQLPR